MSRKKYTVLVLLISFIGLTILASDTNHKDVTTPVCKYKSVIFKESSHDKGVSMIITDPQRINEFIEWLKKNRIQADPCLAGAHLYRWRIIFSSTEPPSFKDSHVDYLYITIFGFIDEKSGRIIDGSNAENYEIVERRVKEIRDFFKKYGKPFSEYNNKIFNDNESDKNYESRL